MVTAPSDRFGTWAGIEGWLGERVVGICVGGSTGLSGFVRIEAGFFCRVRIPIGSTCARRR